MKEEKKTKKKGERMEEADLFSKEALEEDFEIVREADDLPL